MALTPAAAAAYAADQRFPALITSISLMDAGADSSTYFVLGNLIDPKLTYEPVQGTYGGDVPFILGYKIAFEATVVASGTAMQATLVSLIQNAHDTRLTDINGHTWTFVSANFQLTHGMAIEGNFENEIKMPVTGADYLTAALFTSTFTASA